MHIHFTAVLCAGGALALNLSGVQAQDTTCDNELGDVEVRGNLNITSACTLTRTEVRGNVVLFAGGSLVANDVRIRGNLDAFRADFVTIDESRIDGSVRLQELVGDESSIRATNIRSELALVSNRSRFEITNNEADALTATANTGGLRISGNRIDRNLLCLANVPAPTGRDNRVRGLELGQCAEMQPDTEPGPEPTPNPPTPTPNPPTPTPDPPTPTPNPPAPTPTPDPEPTPSPPTTPAPDPTPPASTPPSAAPPVDEGGVGAIDWSAAMLLPLFVLRRLRRRR